MGRGANLQTLQTWVCSRTLGECRARAPRIALPVGRTRRNFSERRAGKDEGHELLRGLHTRSARKTTVNSSQTSSKCCSRLGWQKQHAPAAVLANRQRPSTSPDSTHAFMPPRLSDAVELRHHNRQGGLPTAPSGRPIATESAADLLPSVALSPHPDEVTLLHLQPEYPLHRLQHAVDGHRLWWEVNDGRFGSKRFPGHALDGWPAVEVALDPNGWKTMGRARCLPEAVGDEINGPLNHGDAPWLRTDGRRCGARARARSS